MKLLSCYVENFGKLSDFSIEFKEGINVIEQSNAWGKSTLAAFLKAMFYGLDAKKDPKAFDKERNIYRPWQGGTFGGWVDFEIAGQAYRISRSFGKTEKTDSFHLFDLTTNLESTDYTEEIGQELFDLDSTSFRRSILIGQKDCACEASDGINAKLGNLGETTNDINNFEIANKALKELLNQLTPDRVTGSIKKRKNLITQIRQDISGLEGAVEGYEKMEAKQQALRAQIEELVQIRENYAQALVVASEDSRKAELYKQYERLCEEVRAREEAMERFAKVFPKGAPAKQELDQQMQTVRALEVLKTSMGHGAFRDNEKEGWNKLTAMFGEKPLRLEAVEDSISALSVMEDFRGELAKLELRLEAKQKLKQEVEQWSLSPVEAKSNKGIGILGAVLLLFGLVVGANAFLQFLPVGKGSLGYVVAAVGVILGVVCIAIGTTSASKRKNAHVALEDKKKKQLDEICQELATLTEQVAKIKENSSMVATTIQKFLAEYGISCELSQYRDRLYELKSLYGEYIRLKSKREEYLAWNDSYEKQLETLREFARTYDLYLGEDLLGQMNHLQNKAIEYRMAKAALEESTKKKEQFEAVRDPGFWTKEARCPYSLDELNRMIKEADWRLEEMKNTRNQYEKQLEYLKEQLDQRDERKAELEEVLRDQEEDQEKYRIAKLTQEYLQSAKEQFVSKYMEPIASGFAKYYGLLTGRTDRAWMIDANLNLRIREQGEYREIPWMSAGYQDLLGVCMRLALVDAMYQDEKPFLILDDPFVNLDDKKIEHANQLLLQVAKEYQMIYFTCSKARRP